MHGRRRGAGLEHPGVQPRMPAPVGPSRPGPLCSIVPPYLLEAIVATGQPQSASAARTLLRDATLRERRSDLQAATEPAGEGHSAQAPTTRVHPTRHILDAHTGHPVEARDEGAPAVADLSVNRAYDGLGATFGFYRDVFARNSLDDRGLPLRAQVHVGNGWDNAQWDGAQMLFGDGDGEIFGDFTASLDVIGHELTHGVTQYEAQFAYQGQSGALNESMSDVFGSMVKQYAARQSVAEADWLIGAELLLPGVHGVALRSMKAPGTAYDDPRLGGKDPQPAHMRDFVHTADDEGGVHINSGIPNLAFYRTAAALGGTSWEGAGPIWYAALRDRTLPADASFSRFAAATATAARTAGTSAVQAVHDAWAAVGVHG